MCLNLKHFPNGAYQNLTLLQAVAAAMEVIDDKEWAGNELNQLTSWCAESVSTLKNLLPTTYDVRYKCVVCSS